MRVVRHVRASGAPLSGSIPLWALGLFALLGAEIPAQEQAPPSARSVVEALLAAFNQHDPAAMAALVTTDFELYYIDDQGVAELSLRGPDGLRAEMTGYFANRPNVRSRIAGVVDGPVFVSFREQVVGGQSSLAVYEVRAGLIKRVWYFPAES